MRPYNGPGIIKQLAHLRESYKGKNMSGGRKCFFTQSRAYKRGDRYGNTWASNVTKLASAWCNKPDLKYFVPKEQSQ